MSKYHTFVLKNGVRGVIAPIPGLRSATVEVFVKIGSKYELTNEHGMSHFLEHMAFKGTQKRPTSVAINNEIDSKGASYNAGTGYENTSYYITTVKENISWAIEIISDILLNSTFPKNEVEKERGVVIEEIRMYQDNPMMGLSSDFIKFLYGKSKIGCWNISGEPDDIVCVNRDKVIDYHQKYFNPKEMVVVLSGNVDLNFESIVREYFEEFNNQKAVELPQVEVSLNTENKTVLKKEIEQGHFCMGVQSLPWTDNRRYALKLLDVILSGNTSSRLYTIIREEKAWAYYIFPISDSFKEAGFLGIQSGVRIDKLEQAEELVAHEFINLKNSLKEVELTRAKEFLIGKTQLAMDKTDFVSGYIGEKLLLENEVLPIENELDRYQAVLLSDIKDLCQLLFTKDSIKSIEVTK
jgi:predicted Zn-dependent peptidase